MKNLYFFGALFVILSITSCSRGDKNMMQNAEMSIDVALPVTDSLMLRKSYPASLSSIVQVNLVARVNGFLEKINFKAGQYVKKGDLLFVIEPSSYQDAVTQAEAALATAKSQNEYARSNYESMKEAAKTNAVSIIDLQQSESQLNQSIAAIKNAQASLSIARTNLSYCYIKAPCNGLISKCSVDIGNFLNGAVSPQKLATLYDNSNVYANFSIEDTQYLKMLSNRGKVENKINYDNVNISFAVALPHEYTGKLDYLSPAVELSTGTLSVRAIINNKFNELKDGMYATVHLPYKEMQKAILINDASIGTDQLGNYVYVVNDSNKVVYTPVQTGDLYQDTLRIIMSGLSYKDKYVTKALLKVRDGMIVKPILTKN